MKEMKTFLCMSLTKSESLSLSKLSALLLPSSELGHVSVMSGRPSAGGQAPASGQHDSWNSNYSLLTETHLNIEKENKN